MTRMIQCAEHGEQAPAYICQHLFAMLQDRFDRGLHWSLDEEGNPNAFCDDCANYYDTHGPDAEGASKVFDIMAICTACFENLKQISTKRIN
jgi:hypothetical protein